MSGLRVYEIVLKYEIKSFLGYIREKNSRLAGFIIGIVLLALYLLLVYFIFSNPLVQELLMRLKADIRAGMSFILLAIFLFALSGGFSIVTSVRKNQRIKINLFLHSPTSPRSVFRIILLINALIVVLFMVIISYPAMVAILLTAGFDVLSVTAFGVLVFLGTMAFATVGASLGIFYVRLTRKKKLILWIILAVVAGYIYAAIYSPNSQILSVLMGISGLLLNPISPIRWYSSPLYFEVGGLEELIFVILAIVLSISMIEGTIGFLHNRYVAGFIKSPEERIRLERISSRGIAHSIFGPRVGGLFRKELKMVSREPALVSSILFAYVVYIFLLLNFVSGSAFEAPSPEARMIVVMSMVLMFASIMAVLPSMSIIPTTLAMEKQNLALLLSSPIDPADIVRAKVLVADVFVGVTVALLIPICIIYLPLRIALLVLLLIFVLTIFATGLMAYVAVRWTNFKAENPRKALKTAGGLIAAAMIFVLVMISMGITMILVAEPNTIDYLIFAVLLLIPVAYVVRRKLIKIAGGRLGKIEATEYL